MIRALFRESAVRLPLMSRGLGLVWRAARPWTVAWAGLLVAQGLVPAAQVWLTRTAVDTLAAALPAGDAFGAFAAVWPPLALIGLLWIVGQALSSLAAWVRSVQGELVEDHIKGLVHRQALRLDLDFFERPESYDLMYHASSHAVQQPLTLIENLGAVVQHGLTLSVLALFLAGYAWWLPFLLLGSALPGLWVAAAFVFREHQWRLGNIANERRAAYFDWMITEREGAAELRLFDLGAHYRQAYQRIRAELRAGRLGLARRELQTELAANAVAWVVGLAGLGWMLRRAFRGLARLGDLVLCYQAFQQGQSLLRSLFRSAGQIYRSALYLGGLFQFLDLEPTVTDAPNPAPPPVPLRQGIRFDRVTFRYPGSSRVALADFSLTLEAGRVTAIVGHNGSGKSTLVKLLCRFYDPQQGSVQVDGADLRSLQIGALRRQIAVLFQTPVRYHATAAENIALGALDSAPEPGRIEVAARAAAVDEIIRRLPRGYETVLGQWFGGAELSVGEWQRLALARTFLRDAGIIVLDEPTSAMDAWAETEWLSRFREIAAGRTALVITHRFTTAMHADVIHVMDAGKVVESGTHAGLIASGGHYAECWRAQMREVGTP
jgi:ATP-binding cassette subfamily B protein